MSQSSVLIFCLCLIGCIVSLTKPDKSHTTMVGKFLGSYIVVAGVLGMIILGACIGYLF